MVYWKSSIPFFMISAEKSSGFLSLLLLLLVGFYFGWCLHSLNYIMCFILCMVVVFFSPYQAEN
jgi:hypothetical protein